MLEKHRSVRGTITSKIKESVFAIFGENLLSPINLNASAADINQWKSSANIRWCYDNLFQPMAEGSIVSYMARILERVWPKAGTSSQTLMAYAISVCQILLNPDNNHIKITKKIIRKRFLINLVSFATLCK